MINSAVCLDFSQSKTSVVTARLGNLDANMKLFAFGNITWDCSGSPPPPKCLLVPRPSIQDCRTHGRDWTVAVTGE